MKKTPVFIFYGYLLLLTATGFAQLPGHDVVYKIIPKERVMQLIREQAYPKMAARGINELEINARFSSRLSALADEVADNFGYEADLKKIQEGDSIALKRNTTGRMKARWENNLKLIIDKYLSSDGYQWKMLIARDYGDRIIVFHSDIHVDSSSKVKVKETIVVFNGSGDRSPDIDYNVTYDPNNDIQRGIVRDFPTIYLDSNGFYYSVGFNLLSVTHNGKKAGYKTEYLNNGQRIFVGEESVFIPDGLHTYVFEYETTRQIIHHDDKDELYWNVNGNGWVFYADSVSCTIQFPEGSRIVEDACYTGVQGSTDRYCRSDRLAPDRIHFYNLARFNPWEGLTVAASVQKGVLVPAPPRTWKEILQDNYGVGLLAIALAFLSIFYFTAWLFKGRDPKKGTIFPQFEPPSGLSPPDVGYIHKQQYGSHLFVAALVDMAVKKYLTINIDTPKSFWKSAVYSFKNPSGVSGGAGNHLNSLYGFRPSDFHGRTIRSGEYNAHLKSCYDGLKSVLESRFRVRRGRKNTWHGLFVRNDGFTGCGSVLVFVAFGFAVVYVLSQYTQSILIACGALIFGLFFIHAVFVRIMSAYTQKGREIADHIEGFKMYLETAEQKLFAYHTPPHKTLELFEKYLPYAIALQVENEWAEKFDDVLQKAISEGYSPSYYSSTGSDRISFARSFSSGDFSRSVSAGLSSTIASASTPPSSSGGGSGGGGSSGGGGGGGGGGGW